MIYKEKPKKKKERKMFRLDDELLTKLERLAKLEQKDLSTTIRELLEEAIEIREKYYQKHLDLLKKIINDKEDHQRKSEQPKNS